MLLGACMWLSWFERSAVGLGNRVVIPPRNLTPWEALTGIDVALVAVAALAIVLALFRLGPWLVGISGLALVVLMAWAAVATLGHHAPGCCPELATETTPALGLIVAAVGALSVAVGGLWAAESE